MELSHQEKQSSSVAIDSTLESQLHAEHTAWAESENGSQSFPSVNERYQAVQWLSRATDLKLKANIFQDADSAIGSMSTTSVARPTPNLGAQLHLYDLVFMTMSKKTALLIIGTREGVSLMNCISIEIIS
jgi:hypothetical protein